MSRTSHKSLLRPLVVVVVACLLIMISALTEEEAQTWRRGIDKKDWKRIEKTMDKGDFHDYFSPSQAYELFDRFALGFPEIVSEKWVIGQSVDGNDIVAFSIGINKDDNDSVDDIKRRPAVLLTAMHDGATVSTLALMFYLLHKIAYDVTRAQEVALIELLKENTIFILPLVNPDAYQQAALRSHSTENPQIYHKNHKKTEENSSCTNESVGTNLFHNYSYQFGVNTEGDDSLSSDEPCKIHYRGSGAFSEPETEAVRDFLTEYGQNIVYAINYDSFDNSFILPYNWAQEEEGAELGEASVEAYEDMLHHGKFPEGVTFGTRRQLELRRSDGDPTDFMYHDYDILAATHKIGTNDKNTKRYFPKIHDLMDLMRKNFSVPLYLLHKLGHVMTLKLQSVELVSCRALNMCYDRRDRVYTFNFTLQNGGRQDWTTMVDFFIQLPKNAKVESFRSSFAVTHHDINAVDNPSNISEKEFDVSTFIVPALKSGESSQFTLEVFERIHDELLGQDLPYAIFMDPALDPYQFGHHEAKLDYAGRDPDEFLTEEFDLPISDSGKQTKVIILIMLIALVSVGYCYYRRSQKTGGRTPLPNMTPRVDTEMRPLDESTSLADED